MNIFPQKFSASDQYAKTTFHKRIIHLAARWIPDRGVDIAIWGARRPDQLEALDQVLRPVAR